MQGLIILDGPDACGKTTLAEYFKQRHSKVKYIHMSYIKDNREMWREQYLVLWQASYLISMGYLVVIDRHWPSEQVYSSVYRNGTKLDPEARGWDRVVQKMSGIYIICVPSDIKSAVARHAKSHTVRDEMYLPGPEIASVAAKYLNLWQGADCGSEANYIEFLTNQGGMCQRPDTMHYDIDRDGAKLSNVHDRAMVFLQARQDAWATSNNGHDRPNLLGHPSHAKVLFVGDKINPNKTGRWPFIDYGASSGELSRALAVLRFNELHGMWTNSDSSDVHVHELLEAYDLEVIALGSMASRWLSNNSVEHTTVVHPSYALRFGQGAVLRQQLSLYLPQNAKP